MPNAWGKSWGASWGSAWGGRTSSIAWPGRSGRARKRKPTIKNTTLQTRPAIAIPELDRRKRKKRKQRQDEDALLSCTALAALT